MKDLGDMTALELEAEALRLRAAIRQHRDERGHNRCWLDDLRLYGVLPEGPPSEEHLRLPPRGEFLAGCERYYELRRPTP